MECVLSSPLFDIFTKNAASHFVVFIERGVEFSYSHQTFLDENLRMALLLFVYSEMQWTFKLVKMDTAVSPICGSDLHVRILAIYYVGHNDHLNRRFISPR